jgi:hypothetical protein
MLPGSKIAAEHDAGSESCRRSADRETVLKGAQLVFRDSIIDCVVANISPNGARVRTAAVVPVPERLTLMVRGGSVIPAERRWARGTEIGLAFVGSASLREERAQQVRATYALLCSHGLHAAIQDLRGHNFFDDPELHEAAEAAEAAHARFEAVVKARARGL